MRAALLAFALLAATPLIAHASDDPTAYVWRQQPGREVPRDIRLRDEHGQVVMLGDKFDGRPVVLDLGYYECPTLCGVVRADLIAAAQASGLSADHDYRVVLLSIDPAETPRDAARAKAADAAATDWSFLTGAAGSIAAVADAVGFRSRFDPALKQFLHPAGLVVLTGSGQVSSYLLGVGYTGGDLRAAILRAREGGIAQASLPILLLCFHFDPTTGRYTLAIEKILRIMAVLTVLTLGGLLVVLHRQPRRV